jgi:hypothetical protein
MSTTVQLEVEFIFITAHADIYNLPVEVVIFTPVNVTVPSITNPAVPVVTLAETPVGITVAKSTLTEATDVVATTLDNVTVPSPVNVSSPRAVVNTLPDTSIEAPASAVNVPVVEFN